MSGAPQAARRAPRLTRRDLLRMAAAAGLVVTGAGCSSSQSGRSSAEESSAPTADLDGDETADDDVALVVAAIADELRLLDACSGAVAAHPGLRGQLASTRAAQHVHLAVLRGALTVPPPPSTRVTEKAPARSAQVALDGLVRDFAGTQQRRLHECLAASSGPLARLLASIAASHAVTSRRLTSAT